MDYDIKYCETCKQRIASPDWPGWGEPPYCGLDICSCDIEEDELGRKFPVLQRGDIMVDRTYHASLVKPASYGYRAKNVVTIQRPNDFGILVSIWHRKIIKYD